MIEDRISGRVLSWVRLSDAVLSAFAVRIDGLPAKVPIDLCKRLTLKVLAELFSTFRCCYFLGMARMHTCLRTLPERI